MLVLITLVLLSISGLLIHRGNVYKKTSNIWETNFRSAESNKAIQKELTWKQTNEFYNGKYDSIVKTLKVKKQRVTNIVDIKYSYKDSTILHTKFQTIELYKDRKFFTLDSGCLNIKGYVTTDSITVISKKYQDNLTLIMFEKYKWKFLCFHGKKWMEAKIYSDCLKDTIEITNNIKIIK